MKAAKLRAYMVWSGPDPSEGAVLVFDYSSQSAKVRAVGSVIDGGDFVDLRSRWLRDPGETAYLFETYHPRDPVVIDDPVSCKECELWGGLSATSSGGSVCRICGTIYDFGEVLRDISTGK